MVRITKTKPTMFSSAGKPEQHGKPRREKTKQQSKWHNKATSGKHSDEEIIGQTSTHNYLASGKPQQSWLGGDRKHSYRLQTPMKDDKTAHNTKPTLQKRLQSSPILPKASPLEHTLVRSSPSQTRSKEPSGTATSEYKVRPPVSNTSAMVTGDAPVMPKAWNTASCCGRSGGSRIVGGAELFPAHQYPWQAALSMRYGARCGPFCGGSVINDVYVLTAAHCTDGQHAWSLEVCLGMHSSSDPDVLRVPVAGVVQHAGYDSNTIDKDIALLRLSKPVQFGPTVAPVCLPDAEDGEFTGVPATISGWGTLHFGGPQPEELMTVDVQTVSNSDCEARYGYGAITRYMLCAYAEGKDSCQGDSGGPLTTVVGGQSTQIGVVSFGKGCAEAGFPGVYARVTELRQWINENTLDGHGC